MIDSIHSSSPGSQAMEAMRQNHFKKIDVNGDEKITKDELQAALPKNGKGPSVDKIFAKLDVNHDGAIDSTEDKAAMEKMRQSRHVEHPKDIDQFASKLADKADGDSDGNISKQDLVSALPKEVLNTSMADDIFKAADIDQNGSITKAELEDTVKKLMKEMQAKTVEDAHASYDQRGGAKGISGQANFNAVA